MILKKKETLRNPHAMRTYEHIFVVDQEEKNDEYYPSLRLIICLIHDLLSLSALWVCGFISFAFFSLLVLFVSCSRICAGPNQSVSKIIQWHIDNFQLFIIFLMLIIFLRVRDRKRERKRASWEGAERGRHRIGNMSPHFK